jgi:hypothetical protein
MSHDSWLNRNEERIDEAQGLYEYPCEACGDASCKGEDCPASTCDDAAIEVVAHSFLSAVDLVRTWLFRGVDRTDLDLELAEVWNSAAQLNAIAGVCPVDDDDAIQLAADVSAQIFGKEVDLEGVIQ